MHKIRGQKKQISAVQQENMQRVSPSAAKDISVPGMTSIVVFTMISGSMTRLPIFGLKKQIFAVGIGNLQQVSVLAPKDISVPGMIKGLMHGHINMISGSMTLPLTPGHKKQILEEMDVGLQ